MSTEMKATLCKWKDELDSAETGYIKGLHCIMDGLKIIHRVKKEIDGMYLTRDSCWQKMLMVGRKGLTK
jgi:bacillopeptidase F (M6 metalloprotease family)